MCVTDAFCPLLFINLMHFFHCEIHNIGHDNNNMSKIHQKSFQSHQILI